MSRRQFVWDPAGRACSTGCLSPVLSPMAFFTDPERDLHETLGLTVLALVALRLVWGLFGSRHARFSDFPPSTSAALSQLREMATGLQTRPCRAFPRWAR